jgi:hypothetical protein
MVPEVEVTMPDLVHSSRTTPAGSAATMELRPQRGQKRRVIVAAAGALLVIGAAVLALKSGTTTMGQAAGPVAAVQAELTAPAEAVRAPLPAEAVTPPADLDSKPADPAPTHPGAVAAKARPKASKSGPGTPAKPAPKPVYTRD